MRERSIVRLAILGALAASMTACAAGPTAPTATGSRPTVQKARAGQTRDDGGVAPGRSGYMVSSGRQDN